MSVSVNEAVEIAERLAAETGGSLSRRFYYEDINIVSMDINWKDRKPLLISVNLDNSIDVVESVLETYIRFMVL